MSHGRHPRRMEPAVSTTLSPPRGGADREHADRRRGRLKAVGRRPSLARGERRMAWLMVSPTVLVVLAVALIPVFDTIWLSLHNATVVHTGSFAGLSNYSTIFSDPTFRKALLDSAIFTVVSVAAELAIGVAV